MDRISTKFDRNQFNVEFTSGVPIAQSYIQVSDNGSLSDTYQLIH